MGKWERTSSRTPKNKDDSHLRFVEDDTIGEVWDFGAGCVVGLPRLVGGGGVGVVSGRRVRGGGGGGGGGWGESCFDRVYYAHGRCL